MATVNGALLWQEGGNPSSTRYDTLGKDSEVIAVNDPLTISSGVLAVAGTTNTVIGVAQKAATMAGTNDTVYPPFIPADDRIWLMGSNGDFTDNETDGGTYYKLTGTTGAVQVDQASGVQTGASRVVEIVKVDPYGIGGTGSGNGVRNVLVRFVKTPYTNVNITA